MDPLKPNDVEAALREQQLGALKGTAFFAGLGLLNQTAPGTVDYFGSRAILEFLSATHRKPTGYVPKISPFALLYLAPAPLGVTPPEAFGLPPDYLGRVGSGAIPKSHFLATEATPERVRTYETAQRLKELIVEPRAVRTFGENLTGGTGPVRRGVFEFNPERLNRGNRAQLESDLAFLRSLPPKIPPQLSGLAGLHGPLTEAKLEPIIEAIEARIDQLRAREFLPPLPRPADTPSVIPSPVTGLGGAAAPRLTPEQLRAVILGDPEPSVIPTIKGNPLPQNTRPAFILVAAAAAQANDVVRQIQSERADP